jgi:cyanophycin synthetase
VADVSDLYVRDEDALFNVVRSQVDVVLSEGASVLNAADPQVVKLADLSDGGVIFYALDENNPVLQQHRAAGGRVAFVREQHIVLAAGLEDAPLLGLSKLKPSTAAQPEAVLAAAAAAWALDVPTDLICAGLRSFEKK